MGRPARTEPIAIAGRVREQALLTELVSRAEDGHPGLLVVHGGSGVGKTRLAEAICSRAAEAGAQVLWGRCLRFGATSSSYLPFVTALESWLGARSDRREALLTDVPGIGELLPSLGGSAAVVEPMRMLAVLERAVVGIAARAPAVLVIDDLQWADQSSLDVLAYLLTGLSHERLAVLLLMRDADLPEGHRLHGWLAEMLRLPLGSGLPVPPLTSAETGELLELRLGRPAPPDLVDDVFARAAGNPYLSELLVHDLDPGADRLPDGLPDALRSALLARWHGLTTSSRQVVKLLAVAGRPSDEVDLAAAATAAGMDEYDVESALREAGEGSIVQRDRSEAWWFWHPLLAEVLYNSLLQTERRRLHEAFVETFSAVRNVGSRRYADLALHCDRAGRYDEALEYSLRAAQQAAEVQAFREEALLRRRASELWRLATPEVRSRHGSEAAMLITAAETCRWAGDEVAALRMADRAREAVIAEGDPLRQAHVLTVWGEITYMSGAGWPSEEFREAVRLSAPYPDSAEHARALADLAQNEMWSGDTEAARRHADLAVEAARAAGDQVQQAFALGARCLATLGRPSCLADAEESYRLAVASGRPESVAIACVTMVNGLEDVGRYADCATACLEGHAVGLKVGIGGLTALLAAYGAQFCLLTGRLAEADRLLREVLSARPVGLTGIQARVYAVVAALRRDDLAAAERHLHEARALDPRFDRVPALHGPNATVGYLLAVGRPREALGVLQDTIGAHAPSDPKYAELMLSWGAEAAADWAVDARDRGADDREPITAYGALLSRCHDAGVHPFQDVRDDPVQLAVRAVHDAELARCRNDPHAADHWARAVEAAAESDARYLHLETLVRWAEALITRPGGRPAAVEALREAHRKADAMGAVAVASEVAAVARSARINLEEPRLEAPTEDHRDALQVLTGREREVLAHLVAGRSYGEIARSLFISEKTVSVHVSNLMRKTGTSSRVEAAAWARRRGIGRHPARPSR